MQLSMLAIEMAWDCFGGCRWVDIHIDGFTWARAICACACVHEALNARAIWLHSTQYESDGAISEIIACNPSMRTAHGVLIGEIWKCHRERLRSKSACRASDFDNGITALYEYAITLIGCVCACIEHSGQAGYFVGQYKYSCLCAGC